MSRSILLAAASLLLACPTAEPDPDVPEPTPAPRVGPEYSGASCPTLEHGFNAAFATGETTYDVRVELPPDPDGAPVLFVWHWLGGTADQIVTYLDFDELAQDEDVIVIAPFSSGSAFEWSFLIEPDENPDYRLFEDLLSCAWQQWGVDLDRVWSTGMSAGGLWTSYLTMHGADWLAATAPLSGGVLGENYERPSRPLPVLLTWGGPSDSAVGFDFHLANTVFSEELRMDASFVAECEHDEGHVPPPDAADLVWRFLSAHPMDLEEEPWADGVPDDLPDFCALPEPLP